MTSADVVTDKPPVYTGAFKAAAVEAVLRGSDIRAVADEMGVPEPNLHLWMDYARKGLAEAADDAPKNEPAAAAATDKTSGDEMAQARKSRRPHSPEVRAKALAAVRAGKKAAQVGREMGIDKSVIRDWLNKADDVVAAAEQDKATRRSADKPGADAPPAGLSLGLGQHGGGSRARPPAERLKGAQMVLDEGRRPSEVAAKYNVTESAVYNWVALLKQERGEPKSTRGVAKQAAPKPDRQAALEQVFERPKKQRAAARTSRQQTALALPTVNGQAHVLSAHESSSTMTLRAENEMLRRQNRMLKEMLDLAMKGHGLAVIEAER